VPARVTFGSPTAISHRPNIPPPAHYAGLVATDSILKTTSGGMDVVWGWAPMYQEWIGPNSFVRVYYDDGTYTVAQAGVLHETGTWVAVA
jgi:hypothetical protein